MSIRLCHEFNNEKRQRNCGFGRHLSQISKQFLQGPFGKQQRETGGSCCISGSAMRNMTLKIEGRADQTAKNYKFSCSIFRLDKTSLHQGL